MESLYQKLIQSSQQFIPPSHKHLLLVAFDLVEDYPVMSVAIMGILIEHGLRLLWCESNNIQEKIARPGAYYVTLDGHSQRDRHDVILLPLVSSNGSRNQLVHQLGGTVMALLTDLFASPPGTGPNVRASVAHGMYNQFLYKELARMATLSSLTSLSSSGEQKIHQDSSPGTIDDVVYSLMVVLETVAFQVLKTSASDRNHEDLISRYRPVFSYSATMISGINNAMNSIQRFSRLIESEDLIRNAIQSLSPEGKQKQVSSTLSALGKHREAMINQLKDNIFHDLEINCNSPWSDEDTFREVKRNMIASECGASILLLNEVAIAVNNQVKDVQQALSDCTEAPHSCSSRRRKQIGRLFSQCKLSCDFYVLCTFVALIDIQNKIGSTDGNNNDEFVSSSTIIHAVKRSRMVASTYYTSTNKDRAIKALSDYLVGKSMKVILNIDKL
mmetsp:Transcript_5581/g.8332  ORF Transcript_5581/g.8332 Transcript_5581/m.8332 type:complete len:444 (+) Transcript_5581:2-1333(+)